MTAGSDYAVSEPQTVSWERLQGSLCLMPSGGISKIHRAEGKSINTSVTFAPLYTSKDKTKFWQKCLWHHDDIQWELLWLKIVWLRVLDFMHYDWNVGVLEKSKNQLHQPCQWCLPSIYIETCSLNKTKNKYFIFLLDYACINTRQNGQIFFIQRYTADPECCSLDTFHCKLTVMGLLEDF